MLSRVNDPSCSIEGTFDLRLSIPSTPVRRRKNVLTLDDLWALAASPPTSRNPADSAPPQSELHRAYFGHAIRSGTAMASRVRLEMKGAIKIKDWIPFTATQVVDATQGFVWKARAHRGPFLISGFDRYTDGIGEMRWKLLGLIPVMNASGKDISRSARDRDAIEKVLLPSSLSGPEVACASATNRLTLEAPGLSPVTLELGESGRVRSVSMLRWGNPDGKAFGRFPFGGYVDEEATWGGFTIPSKLRLGWHFGTERFQEGEFFRVTITHAEFR